jgi:hypothetical protein
LATSTVPAFKKKLKELLVARPNIVSANVLVSWGLPGNMAETEFIALLGTEGEQEAAALGAQKREEEFFLTLVASVLRGGDDQQSAEERAWELVAEVENQLRSDATVGATVREAQIAGEIASGVFHDPKEQVTEGRVVFQVRARARI